MGYVDNNLVTGEVVTYRGGLHWVVLFGPLSIALILGLSGLAMFVVGRSADNAALKESTAIVGAVAVFIAVVCLLVGIVRKNSAEFAITNKRVIFKTGVVQRRTEEIFLHKIESVAVDQGLLGRMLNFGTVSVRGTGGTFEPFRNVSHALEFRRQVQEQISQSR
jgi:uncharacterized membrane protein YdbT with pleckstrin-like domain